MEVIAVFACVVTIAVAVIVIVERRQRQQQQQQQQQQRDVPYEGPEDNIHNWVPMEPFPDQPDNFPHDLPVQDRNDVILDDLDIISLDGTISPPSFLSVTSAGSLDNSHRRRRREIERALSPSSITSGSSTSSLCCGICLDRLSGERIQATGVQSTFCGHLYCRDCLFEWVDGHGTCPTCQRPTTRQQVHPIYFNF